jgi:hypothetical protein
METRKFVGVRDVLGLRLVCENCRASVSFQIDQGHRLPDKCPLCTHDWLNQYNTEHEPLLQLINSIRRVLAQQQRSPDQRNLGLPVSIQFEVEATGV